MRPYTNGVVQGAAAAGKAKAKGKKAAGKVQKGLVKAKVSAVKTSRKLTTSRAAREEVDHLLDTSVATPVKPKAAAAATSPKRSGAAKKTSPQKKKNATAAVTAKKMEKIRSLVSMGNGHSKLQESPGNTPTRRSARAATRAASAASANGMYTQDRLRTFLPRPYVTVTRSFPISGSSNGHHKTDVEMAEEAMVAQEKGFLTKTLSKIWTASSSSLSSAGSSQQQQQSQPQTPAASSQGCVIS